MVVGQSAMIVKAIMGSGCPISAIVGVFAAGTVLGVGWTLFWLVRAIGPRTAATRAGLNRFSWPSLVGVTSRQVAAHAATVDAETDAWAQVVDLASIADRKFRACGRAVQGFGFVVVSGVACVVVAMVVAG